MGKFQQYLEWLPERFEQAKREGKLDIKSKAEIPDWLKRQAKYGLKNFRTMKDVTKFDSDYVGIIATPTTAYLFDRNKDYHEAMIITLMYKGLLPAKKEYLDYHRHDFKNFPFICLEYRQNSNVMSLSTAYRDYDDSSIKKFMPIIKQMGVPFYLGQKIGDE